ncbi:MAG TPA: hypothetical protein VG323_23365 [Thermoanaerobaculia bacterium]|nr:hypothetical protein [Thermoanaerobaculia bacterium]
MRFLLCFLVAVPLLAQDETKPPQGEPLKYPTGVILVKGAEPSASDTKTPLPEGGRMANDAYKNDYFGLAYTLPRGLKQPFEGPPPSDTGGYALAQLQPVEKTKAADATSVLVTAQDLFFSATPAKSAIDFVANKKDVLPSYYEVERPQEEVTVAGRKFARFDYLSRVAGLHWYVLATEVRCHAVQFVFTGRDTKAMETLVDGLNAMKIGGAAPPCVRDYAAAANVLYRVEPLLTEHRFNRIPVRIVIDTKGRVKHIHFLSAFPQQATAITDALLQWRFKPYVVNGEPSEVETGMVFGGAARRTVAAGD